MISSPADARSLAPALAQGPRKGVDTGPRSMATPRKSRETSTTHKKAATTAPGRTAKVDRGDPILALPSAERWDAWLRANHVRSAGVLLRIPKRSAGNSLTYA